jgi:hypothetical protein
VWLCGLIWCWPLLSHSQLVLRRMRAKATKIYKKLGGSDTGRRQG